MVSGKVVHVSADRLSDQRTGQAFYLANIKVSNEDTERIGVRLLPGMPVLAISPTGQRTALDYLLQPLVDSLRTALREK